jgi:hypothetical protein
MKISLFAILSGLFGITILLYPSPGQQTINERPSITTSPYHRSRVNSESSGSSTNPNLDDESSSSRTKPIKFYGQARRDQSGMQLRRFFELDAIAFSQNGLVGGACRTPIEGKKLKHREQHIKSFLRLLEAFGMNETYRYDCPTEEELASGEAVMINEGQFSRTDWSSLFTSEWVENLQLRFTPSHINNREDGRLRVAVHIRRGDIDFCNRFSWRYLPNLFYENLLDQELPKHCGPNITAGCDVVVYSQSHSFESFAPFYDRGFTVKLDSSMEEAWRAFMQADVMFASRSTFSWAPSFVNAYGKVIFPQYPEGKVMREPLPGWSVVPGSSPLMQAALRENERLSIQQCSQK